MTTHPLDGATVVELEIEAERRARHGITTLAEYYNVAVLSDDMTDADATEAARHDRTVDSYVEETLAVWGLDWDRVRELAVTTGRAGKVGEDGQYGVEHGIWGSGAAGTLDFK